MPVRCSGTTAPMGRTSACIPIPPEGPEASAIMFGMVADVANRTLWVAPGNPCTNAFEPYALDDLLG